MAGQSQISPDVSASEIEKIVQENLEAKLWQIIPQKSIILAPVNQIKENILTRFPQVRSILIDKKMPHLLRISVEERKSIGLWCQTQELDIKNLGLGSDGEKSEEDLDKKEQEKRPEKRKIKKCFFIDKEGIIYKEAPLMTGSLFLLIYSSENQRAEIRKEMVSPRLIDFILKVREGWPEIKTAVGSLPRLADFEILSIEDLRANTSEGWQILFNPSFPAESQIEALEMILEEEIKESRPFLEYIDLRIEGRGYYKIQNNEIQNNEL